MLFKILVVQLLIYHPVQPNFSVHGNATHMRIRAQVQIRLSARGAGLAPKPPLICPTTPNTQVVY